LTDQSIHEFTGATIGARHRLRDVPPLPARGSAVRDLDIPLPGALALAEGRGVMEWHDARW